MAVAAAAVAVVVAMAAAVVTAVALAVAAAVLGVEISIRRRCSSVSCGGQGGNNRRGGGGGMFGNTSPEADALQKALDDDAPSGQVKDLLTKYETAQKGRLAKAKEAEEALRQVLTSKQEAQATLLGLLE